MDYDLMVYLQSWYENDDEHFETIEWQIFNLEEGYVDAAMRADGYNPARVVSRLRTRINILTYLAELAGRED